MDPPSTIAMFGSFIDLIDAAAKGTRRSRRVSTELAKDEPTEGLNIFLEKMQILLERQLEALLNDGYIALEILLETRHIFETFSNFTQRMTQSSWYPSARREKFQKRRLDQLLLDIDRLESEMRSIASHKLSETEIPQHHVAALASSGTGKATSSRTTIDSPPNPEAREVMKWLPTLNYQEKQRKCRETRVPGSNHQILHREFERWVDDSCSSTGRCLCCSGPPGAGKTILSSLVVDRLLSLKRDAKIIAFFYFDDSIRVSITDVAGCLLRQLCKSYGSIPPLVLSLYESHRQGIPITVKQLVKAIELPEWKGIYIVLDALDEYTEDWNDLLYFITRLSASPGCKLFLTSRPMPNLQTLPGSDWVHRVDCSADSTSIEPFVSAKIDEDINAGFLMDDVSKDLIIRKFTSNSNGSFLFATLAVPTILEQLSRKGIQHAIDQLPSDTATFIEHNVQRLKLQPKARADLAYHTLLWLSFAKEPLSAQGICEAFAVQEGDSELGWDMIPAPLFLEEVCMGFVQVDGESGIIRFFDKSFRDYLPDYLPLDRTSHFSDGESRMAIKCIQYLLGNFREGPCVSREDLSTRLTQYTFFRYAARHWGHHAQRSQSVEVKKHAIELLNDRERLAACLQVNNEVTSNLMAEVVKDEEQEGFEPQKASGLQIAAQFGLLEIVQDLVRNGDNVNEKSSIGMRPIHEAARAGYAAVIEFLLAEGALTEVFDQKSRTPLFYAAKYGHKKAVDLLIKSSKVYQSGISEEIFVVAAEHGYSDILETLLVIVNGPPIRALLAAVSHGHADATKVLLNAGAQPTGQALCTAVLANDDDMVYHLLVCGAPPNQPDPHGRRAMHYAVQTYQFSTIKLLLRAGADLNCLDTQGQTPLFMAIERKNISMVKHLLRQGADFQRVKKDTERTPLHVAVLKDQPLIVKELLNNGADPNVKDCNSKSPLDLATSEVVRLLLKTEGWSAAA